VSPALFAVGGAVIVVALAWLVGRHGPVRGKSGPAAVMPAFYERALRLLARRGLSPAAAETARQFAGRVRAAVPDRADAFTRLTRHYERARFGASALSEIEWDDVTRSLAVLSAR
jgi:hypothetical protein